ncbi:MAG TPA: SMP-30/gluconolactonase/LRE family protein [Gemmatimonadaceae bacterium]|jgi:sugar lactone lactonase YvrE
MIRHLVFATVAAFVSATKANAQTSAVAESAAVARTAWARAMSALQRDDVTTARWDVDHAAHAWPTQPAYLWGQAVLAQRAGDATAAAQALTRYADLGLGRDLRTDDKFSDVLGDRFEAIAVRHDANRSVIVKSTSRPLLADSTFWPEGIDVDPRTRRLYVASVRHRVVAEVSPSGAVRELWQRDRDDLAPVMGVRVDTARNSIWATTSGLRNVPGFRAADSAKASLLRLDLTSGRIAQRFDLPAIQGGRVLGDLAIGPDGSVWITDSQQPILYRLRPNAKAVEEIRSPLFVSLQGLAPTPDGKSLYLADYSLGMLRMHLNTGAIVALASPDNTTAIGCDGIVWHNGAIIAVQNGVSPARIIRMIPDAEHDRLLRIDVIDRNLTIADEPTIGTILGDEFIYVANSQWEKFSDDGARDPSRPLTPPIALRLPLPR